jgi:long-chain acyl-CoA synthetase
MGSGAQLSARIYADGIYALISGRARARAVFAEWDDRTLTYADLLDDIRRFCGVFDVRGLNAGDRVMILTGNERRAIGAFVAALLDGLVPVMLTRETPADRVEAIAGLVSPGFVLLAEDRCGTEIWTTRHPILAVPDRQSKASIFWPFAKARRDGDNLEACLAASTPRDPHCAAARDDLAYILFTSGTTSAPKGVMITHRNLFAHLETLVREFGYTPESAIFNGMVLAHGDGLVQGPLLALACGCRLIRPPAFTAQALEAHLNMVRARRATHFLSVPSIYAFIDRYAAHDDYFAAPEFEAMVSVAAKLETPLWRRLEERFGRPVYNMYGLTETVTGALYAGPAPGMGPIGSIGRPIDVAARIVHPDGGNAAQGEAGEIWLKGENVSPGYYGAPEPTAERFVDGWLRTGDLARQHDDGIFEITGRLNTVIMCGGFLIQPEEIDEALLRHPAVAEVATVGLSDDDFGEVPVSAVVLDVPADEAELTGHCASALEPRKVPKRIVAAASIPRGDAGKPNIAAVRAMLREVLESASTPTAITDGEVWNTIVHAAAQTFRMPFEHLSPASTPVTVERWDSFAHITLISSVEAQMGVRLPTREVIAVDSLGALAAVVERQVRAE